MKRRLLVFLPLAVLLSGCPSASDQASTPPGPPTIQGMAARGEESADPWVLTTSDPNAKRGNNGIYLGNGALGATFGPSGDAGGVGKAFAAGRYDSTETLAPQANWHALNLAPPKAGEPYTQTLDLKTGLLTTTAGKRVVTAFVSAASPKVAGVRVVDGGTTTEKFADGATGLNFDAEVKKSADTWAARWKGRDIVIEGDSGAQQLVHKLMFDLLQSIRPDGSFSIAPEALSGSFYKGHIFWDAEVWMFPALLAQHPDLAKSMLEYRFVHLAQAKAQAAKQGCKGADFPWESAASGNETAPSGFSEGRHVTGGIGWAVWQYWLATGDKAWLGERGWPLLSNIADYFATKVKKNATGGYDLGPVTGPDELHLKVMNNAYTNAMAIRCLTAATEAAKILGKSATPQWAAVAKGLVVPKNAEGVLLKCDGDDGKATKQADGELLLWPAQAPGADAKTFDFHKTRPIKNGPAMTTSVHALIAARLGRAEEAEQAFQESYRPFLRGPFLMFSEKRSLDRCVFTTACGGVLQSVLYGFGGLDFDHWESIKEAPIALPKSWKKLEISGIAYRGKRFTLTVTQKERTLTEEK